ncbi:MAG: type secretion system protein [Clostridiales bacterium]|jgi:tight adherence protein C|nr:type secretion system protein [Clostridiales bacterium]
MVIIFFLVTAIWGGLYLLSRGKYDEYTTPLDKKEFSMKQLLPIGFFIMDAINYKYSTKYDRRLQVKLAELSGHKYAQFYLKVHWANKISLALLILLIISFVFAIIGPDTGFAFYSLLTLGLVLYSTDYDLDKKIRKRHVSIQIDFPDFINKLALLINAGMTVGRAWEKIVNSNKKESPLYDELEITLADIRSGKAESQAYEDFAKRCRIPEVTKFISFIVQNLKKGNSELVSVLRLQSHECWEMRKNAVKRMGEEASTKMLFPMMIMFLAILIIVVTPAVLAMQGI